MITLAHPLRSLAVAAAVSTLSIVLAAPCSPSQAVVGGRTVPVGANAAIVRLPGCSGALIAPDRVMTAAHCLGGLVPERTRLRIGSALYRVTRWARDPQYAYRQVLYEDPTPYEPPFDAGIIQLDRRVPDVAPLRLRVAAVRPGTLARTIGFGTPGTPMSGAFGTLRAAAVIVRSDSACHAVLERADPAQAALYIPQDNVCVQDPDGRPPYRSACSGDSGSPLLLSTPSGAEVAGIDAWSVACGHRHNDPAVYMAIPSVLSFITAPAPLWAPQPVGMPTIQGQPRVGQKLTCVEPTWVGQPPTRVRFDWETPASGVRGPSYTVLPKDAGGTIICRVEAGVPGGGTIYFPSAPVLTGVTRP